MPDLWFYAILNFFELLLNFRKIRAIVQKLYTNILHVLTLAKIDWSVQIFSDFEFFENFFKIVWLSQISIYQAEILCVNALIQSDVWY